MNKLVVHQSPRTYFHPTFVSVQSVTEEGAPYTFAVIYRNKHRRFNLIGVAGQFYAGSTSQRAVEKYAKKVDPSTTEKYFIESKGRLLPV